MSPTLIEINFYPYLNYVFYTLVLFYLAIYAKNERMLLYLFVVSLALESAFIIDIGFFVKFNHLMGLLVIWLAVSRHRVHFPATDVRFLFSFFFIACLSVVVNYDLIGLNTVGSSRATFLRPIIQLGQFAVLVLIMVSFLTMVERLNVFGAIMRLIHWVTLGVCFYAIYEVGSIYLHAPFIMLNNDLDSYWYMGYGGLPGGLQIFRPRSTFYEPINFNNFLFFGLACSLIYRELFVNAWTRIQRFKYWAMFALIVAVLLLSFSRSVLLIIPFISVLLFIIYPCRLTEHGRIRRHYLVWVLLVFIISVSSFVGIFKYEDESKNTSLAEKILLKRFAGLSSSISILGRAGAVHEANQIFEDNRWVFGIGIGNGPNWRGDVSSFSSIYNQILIYTGIVGFTVFMSWLATIFFRLIRNVYDRRNSLLNRRVNAVFFVGLLALCVQRLSFSGFLTDTYLWVALGTGVLVLRLFRKPSETSIVVTGVNPDKAVST